MENNKNSKKASATILIILGFSLTLFLIIPSFTTLITLSGLGLGSALLLAIAITLIAVLLFIAIRELTLWYYKINDRIKNQEILIEQNKLIIKALNDIAQHSKIN